MKRTALVLALAMALPAWAETPPDAAKPTATPSAQGPAQQPKDDAQAKAEPRAKKSSASHKHSRRMDDARHCLDEPTNTAIIKCAEAYL